MDNVQTTPPLSDVDHEAKLIALALGLAERQLLEGTATSQVVTHFLRLGSLRAQVEKEKIELENNLLIEKIQSEKLGQKMQEMFQNLLESLQTYQAPPPEVYLDRP